MKNLRAIATTFSYLLLFFFLVFGSLFGYLKLTDKTIGLNFTNSLPNYFFVIDKNKAAERNDIVMFSSPEDDAGFIPEGAKFVKVLVGLPGDNVTFKEQKFFINGEFFGEAKTHSLKGKPLEKNHNHKLGADEYFVFTPHKDSFDSRYIYIGYISKEQIIGTSVWEF